MAVQELAVSGITAGYRRKLVLENITAYFPAGQLTAIIGPNGAGKSTLLRTISGYLSSSTGSVTWHGRDLLNLSPSHRARYLAYVPQGLSANIPLTARQFVELAGYARCKNGMVSRAELDTRIERVAVQLGITPLLNNSCSMLSGGEFRKVLLAQGIVQHTPVLLLDEPVAFLDPPARHEVMQQLVALATTQGTCVVAVLHDELLAAEYCQHAVLLRDGSVFAAGKTSAVMTAPLLGKVYGCNVPLGAWENL